MIGMRQLNATGYMHSRVRNITACFLVKDLLINWQRGERYFMSNLIDGDFPVNNGSWQWVRTDLLANVLSALSCFCVQWYPEFRPLMDYCCYCSHIVLSAPRLVLRVSLTSAFWTLSCSPRSLIPLAITSASGSPSWETLPISRRTIHTTPCPPRTLESWRKFGKSSFLFVNYFSPLSIRTRRLT